MNIFILNEDPIQAAQDQCDKHLVKMIVESYRNFYHTKQERFKMDWTKRNTPEWFTHASI